MKSIPRLDATGDCPGQFQSSERRGTDEAGLFEFAVGLGLVACVSVCVAESIGALRLQGSSRGSMCDMRGGWAVHAEGPLGRDGTWMPEDQVGGKWCCPEWVGGRDRRHRHHEFTSFPVMAFNRVKSFLPLLCSRIALVTFRKAAPGVVRTAVWLKESFHALVLWSF